MPFFTTHLQPNKHENLTFNCTALDDSLRQLLCMSQDAWEQENMAFELLLLNA
jgi:hypothetical protein